VPNFLEEEFAFYFLGRANANALPGQRRRSGERVGYFSSIVAQDCANQAHQQLIFLSPITGVRRHAERLPFTSGAELATSKTAPFRTYWSWAGAFAAGARPGISRSILPSQASSVLNCSIASFSIHTAS